MYLSCCYCCCWVTSVVSDSVWPHRWQPTRLPCPWDSPGKNTGVGCHFLLHKNNYLFYFWLPYKKWPSTENLMFTFQEHFYVFTKSLRDLECHFLLCQRPILKAIIKYSSKQMSILLGCCDESKQIYHNNCIKLCNLLSEVSKIYGLQTVSRGPWLQKL